MANLFFCQVNYTHFENVLKRTAFSLLRVIIWLVDGYNFHTFG